MSGNETLPSSHQKWRRAARATACVATLLMIAACSSAEAGDDDESTYSLGSSACTLQSSLSASSDPTLKWSGCIVHYDADSHIVTWQLLPAGGGGGSLLSPAANVIVLSFDRDAPENTTFSTARVVSPLPASVPPAQTVFAYGTAVGWEGGIGTVDVGSNVVDTHGGGGSLSGAVSIKLTNGATVTGSFEANARAQSNSAGDTNAGGGGAGGGGAAGGCADHGKICQSTGNCANGGQFACYCAAAETYACFLAHGCYAEAGATNADGSPTSVTKAKLQSGCSTSLGQASALGGTCRGVSCN